MKTSELTGAQLDYWVARAEGVPAEQLEIRPIQRSTDTHCVRTWEWGGPRDVMRYSTDWAQGGPLLERLSRYRLQENPGVFIVQWFPGHFAMPCYESGSTPLQAICRAVVRSVFGDEVPE